MLEKSEISWSWFHFCWAAVLVLILPNSVMGLFATAYSLERPLVSVDYAVVMLIFLLNQRVIGVFALIVAFSFDVLALVGQIFPILRLSDIPYMAKFVGVAPASYQVLSVVIVLVLLAFVCAFWFRGRQRRKTEFLTCINIVIICYAVTAIFFNTEETRVWSNKERAFVSSQVIYGIDSRRTGFVESLYSTGDLFGETALTAASAPLFADLPRGDDKILLIVNESWGAADKKVHLAIISPLLQMSDKLDDWKEGNIGFKGITIEAEIRELCEAELLHFNFSGHERSLDKCVPNRMKKAGYETFAFHGAAGLMYDRAKWYPTIGFDNTTFFENYSWPSRCYSFPGACDVDMANMVSKAFRSSGKIFGYWLTLNTHHYYDLRDLSVDAFNCQAFGVDVNTAACRNFKLQHQFFSSLADIVSKPHMSGVRVMVVSDHEPRISDQTEMHRYFQEGRIPWVSFRVR